MDTSQYENYVEAKAQEAVCYLFDLQFDLSQL